MMGQPGTNIGSIKVDNRVDVAGVFQCGINRQKEPISKIIYSNSLMMLLTVVMLKYCSTSVRRKKRCLKQAKIELKKKERNFELVLILLKYSIIF